MGYAVNHITEPSVALSFHQERICCFGEFLVLAIRSFFSLLSNLAKIQYLMNRFMNFFSPFRGILMT